MHLLGIDIGTSGSKAVLVNTNGKVIASAMTEYPLHTPYLLWAEQQAEDWWRATVSSISKVLTTTGIGPAQLAIGLTGQMHGLVLLDNKGNVLRPCIMWNDQRTVIECDEITELIGKKMLLELTGNVVLPGFTAPKILWVKKHEPYVFEKIDKILLPKDYIRYRLTHSFFSDVSDASGTSLFDVGRRKWSEDMLRALAIKRQWLPDVTESSVVSSYVCDAAAHEVGLIQGTPVVGGAGDQAAQAVGSGIVKDGQSSVTIGTSGVVFTASDEYRVENDGRLHAFCHAVPGKWHLMGVMLSAGGSLRWYRDTFGEKEIGEARKKNLDPYDILIGGASKITPSCDGLIFLPYLTGERTPYPDPFARGVFFGATLRHTKAHFTRAVIEGISFGLKDSLELMRKTGIIPDCVRVSGGGAKSAVWRQLLADIFNIEVEVINESEGAAYGAALLAGVGAGVYTGVQEAAIQAVAVIEKLIPGKAASIYEKYYPRYQALYRALKDEFRAIAQV